jgi:amino acid transporter
MSEETQGAALAGPISLIATILSGFLVGIAYVISLLFSVQNPASLVDPAAATAGGSAPFQIAWDVFTARFGSGFGALGLFVVPLLCSLFCGNACLTTCSRVVWAFSRDGDLRISRILRWVHPKWKTPVAAVWFSVFCQIILVLPALYNYTAFAAVISIGVIGLYISYLVPLLLRLTVFRHRWIPGPFSLGAASIPVACAAVAWICFGTVLFALPQVFPVTGANLNYAPVSVGVVLVLAGTWWVFNAKSWFKGPRGGWGGGGGMDDDTASGAPPAVVVANGKDADAAAWKRGCC